MGVFPSCMEDEYDNSKVVKKGPLATLIFGNR